MKAIYNILIICLLSISCNAQIQLEGWDKENISAHPDLLWVYDANLDEMIQKLNISDFTRLVEIIGLDDRGNLPLQLKNFFLKQKRKDREELNDD